MPDPIQIQSSGLLRVDRTLQRGRTQSALVQSLGRGATTSAANTLLQGAVTSTVSPEALGAIEALQQKLQGEDGPEILRRLAPQLADQQTVQNLLTGSAFTPSEQARLIAGGLKSLTRGGNINLTA